MFERRNIEINHSLLRYYYYYSLPLKLNRCKRIIGNLTTKKKHNVTHANRRNNCERQEMTTLKLLENKLGTTRYVEQGGRMSNTVESRTYYVV